MLMDKSAIHNTTLKARELLTGEIRDLLQGIYGLDGKGNFEDVKRLPAVALPKVRATRKRLEKFLNDEEQAGLKRPEAVEKLVKEVAFTHLNRLVAFKMMEARKLIRGSVDRYQESNANKFYLAEHEDDLRLYEQGSLPQNEVGEGPRDVAYRHFLLWQCAELSKEIKVLFDPENLASRLFPRPRALKSLLEMLNDPALADAWSQEETVGWIYQYFNENEKKDVFDRLYKKKQKIRPEDIPAATQLFTPRWIVKFLVQNTLGRQWMQMHPAADLAAALEQLKERFETMLDELRLAHGEVTILGAPRRLVVYAREIAPRQPDRETIYKGPPANRAFDASGQATQAAEGFARGKGVALSDLEVREMDGGRYVVAGVQEAGRSAAEILAEALSALIAGLRFDKPMRWNATNVYFSRPIRWLVSLLGDQVMPFTYAGLESGRTTRGLRFTDGEEFEVRDAAEYFAAMRAQQIVLDPQERKHAIARQAQALMQTQEGSATLDEGLLDEVTHLVEAPTAFLGRFEPSFLDLPPEVLVSVMKKHQRYFPVWSAEGKLLPFFVGVRNGNAEYLEVVADGNEQVIRARFADASFFVKEDLQQKLEDYLPRLGTLMFQARLGSMLDKARRVEKLVDALLPWVELSAEETAAARRAAVLCKADLVTHMVVEMTSLQGIMGQYYALHSGEGEMTARAIFEHYLPRFSGDNMPETGPGLAVGLADRLDTLSGLFAAGLAPSGAKDPFAQRRAALGLVQVLMSWNLDFDLRQGLKLAAGYLPVESSAASQAECLEFIAGRLRALLIEWGFRYDVVDAVLAEQKHNPAGAQRAVQQLSEWVKRPDWNTILPAYARCVRITRSQPGPFTLDEKLFQEEEERKLYQALQVARSAAGQDGSLDGFLQAFLPIIPAINRFFDVVLVMAEDPVVRANRLGLVKAVADLAAGIADFSVLEGF